MAKTFQVDIVSAEQAIFSGASEMVIAPGESGELGILPEHAPLLTRIRPGTVRILPGTDGEEEVIYVSGGMMEVQPDRLAKDAIANRTGAMELAKAQVELAEAAAQLQAIRKLRQRR